MNASLVGTTDTDELLDTKEAARALGGIRPSTLEIWRQKSKGPKYVKIGRLVRYPRREINAWLAQQIVGA